MLSYRQGLFWEFTSSENEAGKGIKVCRANEGVTGRTYAGETGVKFLLELMS